MEPFTEDDLNLMLDAVEMWERSANSFSQIALKAIISDKHEKELVEQIDSDIKSMQQELKNRRELAILLKAKIVKHRQELAIEKLRGAK